MPNRIINCPNCGGVVAKDADLKQAKLRCPHCSSDLKVTTKLKVEVYEPQVDTLTRES